MLARLRRRLGEDVAQAYIEQLKGEQQPELVLLLSLTASALSPLIPPMTLRSAPPLQSLRAHQTIPTP